MIEISVVIPNYNGAETLPLTLEALAKQTYPAERFEVIVVDQASTDGSRELLQNYLAPYSLRIILQDGKYGIPVARNAGFDSAAGEVVIFLDSDIIADERLVESHAELHKKNSKPIIGCGRLLPYPPSYSSYIDFIANPDSGLDRGADLEDLPFYWAFGGNLSVSRETYRLVGPFDIQFITAGEDIDFAYRAVGKGIGIKNCANAVGYHNHRRDLEGRRNRSYHFYRKTLPLLIAKYPELKGKIPGMSRIEPIYWGKDSMASISSKAIAEFWSIGIVRKGLYQYLVWAEKRRALPKLTKFCFYRLMLGEMRAGVRQAARTQ